MHSTPRSNPTATRSSTSPGVCVKCGRTLKKPGKIVELIGEFGPECEKRGAHLVTALQRHLTTLGLGALLTPEGVTFAAVPSSTGGWTYSAEQIAFRDRVTALGVRTRCEWATLGAPAFTYHVRVDERLFAWIEAQERSVA